MTENTNDRELLELAATAANITGLRPLDNEAIQGGVRTGLWCDLTDTVWNPLTDDGDALRLAVKLRLEFEWWKNGVYASRGDIQPISIEYLGTDPYAATRRTIVRAAAEIGRSV